LDAAFVAITDRNDMIHFAILIYTITEKHSFIHSILLLRLFIHRHTFHLAPNDSGILMLQIMLNPLRVLPNGNP